MGKIRKVILYIYVHLNEIMKYNFTFSLALFLCFSITLLAQDKDYHITALIKKYPSNAMAYLRYMGPKGEILDSATINNGSFTFKGKIDEPRPAHIVIRELGKSMHHST